MPDQPTMEQSLVGAIAAGGGRDALLDLAEVGLDAVLEDGLLREIPFIGTVFRLARTGAAIRDHLFIKKLARFLIGLDETSTEERRAFIASLSSPEVLQRTGEHLMLLLDRLDDMAKPTLISRIFEAYVRRQLSLDEYRRLCSAIDRLQVSSLPALVAIYAQSGIQVHSRDPEYAVMQEFAIIGLAQMEFGGGYGGGAGCFIQNDLGAKLAIILKNAA